LRLSRCDCGTQDLSSKKALIIFELFHVALAKSNQPAVFKENH